MHSVLEGLRAFGLSPNVFMLALAFSPEWVPDVCFFGLFLGFFCIFSWAEDLKLGDSAGPRAATKTTTQKNWHHLMSHAVSSKRNYIHLNLSNTSPKERQKSVYLQFIAKCKPQRQKWDMCKLLWIHSILSDESRMYRVGREREERHNLCPAYLYDTRLWKGKNQRKAFENKMWTLLPSLHIQALCNHRVSGHQMFCTLLLYHRWSQESQETSSVNKSSL